MEAENYFSHLWAGHTAGFVLKVAKVLSLDYPDKQTTSAEDKYYSPNIQEYVVHLNSPIKVLQDGSPASARNNLHDAKGL